jgi:hypothetical protein
MSPEQFDQVAKAPSSMFKDITAAKAPDSLSPEEAAKGADHTKISTFTTGNEGNPGTATPGSSTSLGGMVQGRWAVELVDSLIPSLLVLGLASLGTKLRKTELQLSEKEKDVLTPIMQQCLDSIMLNFSSPWHALAITVGVMYGSKAAEKGLGQVIEKRNNPEPAKTAEKKRVRTPAKAPVVKMHTIAEAFSKEPDVSLSPDPEGQEEALKFVSDGITEAMIKEKIGKKHISRAQAIKLLESERNK